MYRVIKVGDKEVPMKANAATPIRYRQVFGKNLLPYFMGKATDEDVAEMLGELSYIMAKSAEGADMMKLSLDGYVEWLEGFAPLDFVDEKTVTAIIGLYQGNEDSHVELRPTERQMTISLYMLRAFQTGLAMPDLEQLNYGDVMDMMMESANDSYEYKQVATQEDFDRF